MQIFSRFIEAAAAERRNELSARFDPVERDFPIAPGKDGVVKREGAGVFVFEHIDRLGFVPVVFRRKDAGPEDNEKAVHFGFHFVTKLSDRMMKPGGKLDWNVVFGRSKNRPRNLD